MSKQILPVGCLSPANEAVEKAQLMSCVLWDGSEGVCLRLAPDTGVSV